MTTASGKRLPGEVRDAIIRVLRAAGRPMSLKEIEDGVGRLVPGTGSSSIRSYLRLNTPRVFIREARGTYSLSAGLERTGAIQPDLFRLPESEGPFVFRTVKLYLVDCLEWLNKQPDASFHAVVTDPPYGLHEYTSEQQYKLRQGKGGVWRIPPAFDGHQRSPLPRFTTLTSRQLSELREFFFVWGRRLLPKLVPGANVIVASNPLLSYIVSWALSEAGFERRGELVRLVMTMRGGDRPKGAHREFRDVSVMPRSMWEPWLVYRKPLEGRVQDNLRKWRTGGFRRPCTDKPFGDVLQSAPTRKRERAIAPHPSLKPQEFMRRIVRAALPLGEGMILDPFAGAGSTLAAAAAIGYSATGVEIDPHYYEMAVDAIPRLAELQVQVRSHERIR